MWIEVQDNRSSEGVVIVVVMFVLLEATQAIVGGDVVPPESGRGGLSEKWFKMTNALTKLRQSLKSLMSR